MKKRLLSLSLCGHYITVKDLIEIGKKLNIKLDYKNTKAVIEELFTHAKKENSEKELNKLFCILIDERTQKLLKFIRLYPSSKEVLQLHIQKANSTKILLQRSSRDIHEQ